MDPFTGMQFSCDGGKERAVTCPRLEHELVKKANLTSHWAQEQTANMQLRTILASVFLEFIAPCKDSFDYSRSFKRGEEFRVIFDFC